MKLNSALCIWAFASVIAACGSGGNSKGGLLGGGAVGGGSAGTSAGGQGGSSAPSISSKGGSSTTPAGGSGGSSTISVGGSGGGTCKDFASCGGDIEGTWAVTSTCVSGDFVAYLNNAMSSGGTVPAVCKNMFQNATVDMTGTMTFAGGVLTSDTTSTIRFQAVITPACASNLTGTTMSTMSASMCSTIESQMAGSFGTVTCSVKAGNCSCDIVETSTSSDDQDYVISGKQVVDPNGNNDPMDYCVAGTTLTLGQVSPDDPSVKMVITLRRQ